MSYSWLAVALSFCFSTLHNGISEPKTITTRANIKKKKRACPRDYRAHFHILIAFAKNAAEHHVTTASPPLCFLFSAKLTIASTIQ